MRFSRRVRWGIGLVALAAGAAHFVPLAPARAGVGGPEEARIELGRRLFFDPAISRSGDNACASCHRPDHGFSDPRKLSDDDFLPTRRHSQTLLDTGDRRNLHWDGALATMQELVIFRLAPGWVNRYHSQWQLYMADFPTVVSLRDENGVFRAIDQARLDAVMDRVERDGRYASAFQAAYESASVSSSRLASAIEAFVQTIRHTEAPYDRFAAGDEEALSSAARRGFALFRGKAGCFQCHRIDGSEAPLTDHEFHNTGIEWKAGHPTPPPNPTGETGRGTNIDPVLEDVATRRLGTRPLAVEPGRDPGRARFSRSSRDERSFKTPTLRDVALRGPYMHDGSFSTLEEVVRNYVKGSAPDPNLDPRIKKFEATDADVLALVEFLKSLTGDVRPAMAPDSPLRAQRTRVRFLDAKEKPLAGLRIGLVPAGDSLPGDSPLTSRVGEATTDAHGWIEYAPHRRTHVRLVLPETLRAPQGEMVPDTCESLRLVLPIRGRASLTLHLPQGFSPPKRLVIDLGPSRERLADETQVDHPWSRPASRIVFTLEGEATVAGQVLVRYAAWIPSDAPKSAALAFPGPQGKTTHEVSLRDGADTRIDLVAR